MIIRTYKLKLKIQISEIHFDILLLAIVFQFLKKRKKYNLNLKYTINEKQKGNLGKFIFYFSHFFYSNIKLYILKNIRSIIDKASFDSANFYIFNRIRFWESLVLLNISTLWIKVRSFVPVLNVRTYILFISV